MTTPARKNSRNRQSAAESDPRNLPHRDRGHPARRNFRRSAPAAGGYTLFEILLALGVIAILLGVSVPYIADSFGRSPADEAGDALARTALATRAAALDKGEARRLAVFERGLKPDLGSIPSAELPAGWKLEIRRMTDSKFRKPAKREVWEFNAAGICEPVSFRLTNGRETSTVSFDPLTALLISDE